MPFTALSKASARAEPVVTGRPPRFQRVHVGDGFRLELGRHASRRPDQVALGLPAGPGAAGGGIVAPSTVNNALDCLAKGTNCGTFQPPRTYPGIRGAMTWSINWDVTNGGGFAGTVGPHLDTLP